MTGATTWHGRRGPVLLGPTEHRVARWLRDMTRAGRVTIRTVDLARACRVERSEAYRITRRLRVLGLFGIENDKGGNKGGRRYWRTAALHDGAELDGDRHRAAWARIVAWARNRRRSSAQAIERLRAHHNSGGVTNRREDRAPVVRRADPTPAGGADPPLAASPAGPSFRELFRRYDVGQLLDRWGA